MRKKKLYKQNKSTGNQKKSGRKEEIALESAYN